MIHIIRERLSTHPTLEKKGGICFSWSFIREEMDEGRRGEGEGEGDKCRRSLCGKSTEKAEGQKEGREREINITVLALSYTITPESSHADLLAPHFFPLEGSTPCRGYRLNPLPLRHPRISMLTLIHFPFLSNAYPLSASTR